jgi:FixJ family two-component response regulator
MAPLVAVVDDDVSVRKSLGRLIRSVRLDVRAFASAEEFLNSAPHLKPDCLILDVRLPGMSGIELHRHLLAQKSAIPVIFITAHEFDDLERLKAASDRAVTFFAKPFSGDELLDAVNVALANDARRLEDSEPGESHE